ncbi:PKD domain-containing protein [Olleya sp. ITB9]|uniref:PKD domain-containing protein n=1 Tax=Olleya sp. ITB9 TaxID=1715648 RepID=UPI00047F51AA|nr:PKD domain-containing protein [Olleya sp. ITB9]
MKKQVKKIITITTSIIMAITIQSCDDFEKFEPLDSNSIADQTPPQADFSYSQGEGTAGDEWMSYSFGNLSSSATTYSWDLGNGTTSTDFEPTTIYPGEGMYTVTLTASDNLGVSSTFSETIEVIEPEVPEVPDPTLINSDFDRLAKLGSSNTCSCSGWDNDDIGEQGESSSGNGGTDNVLKFDNNEPDHIYQEFEVVPNSDYTITLVTSFKSLENNTPPLESMLELRVLTGAGYITDYTPTYYTDAGDFPSSGYGYTSISQVETPANNILEEVIVNPEDDGYYTQTYSFNSGANTSLAIFVRGIGGDPSTGSYGYTSGDEEIRVDSINIIANN